MDQEFGGLNQDAWGGEEVKLTLDPFPEEQKETQAAKQAAVGGREPEAKQKSEPAPQIVLSPQEQKMVDEFAAKIDLDNSNMVLQYGAGAQKKIADFSESALGHIKTKDLGEIGQMLTEVVGELKAIDVAEEEKGIFGIFRKNGKRLSGMKARYEKAENHINQICKVLEGHQIQLLKDVAVFDRVDQGEFFFL